MTLSQVRPLDAGRAPIRGTSGGAQLGFLGAPRGTYVRLAKPLIDRIAAGVLLVLAAPLLGIVALALRVRIGRPILFRQRRCGLGGAPFDVVKFRTMQPDRREGAQPVRRDRRETHKSHEDPRHTRLGRRLRAWSLDELPQLWNVVRGEMSLVGPRPELVEVVAGYEGWQHQRHLVKPGLTGLWQVSRRGDGPMHQATDVDLVYVATVSFLTDVRILLRTIPAMLGRTGS